jgi:hypothetical protein
LRSLCDNLIKAKFLYCSPLKHSHVLFLDALIEKRKQLNDAFAYLQRYPQRLSEIKISIKDLSDTLKNVEEKEKT